MSASPSPTLQDLRLPLEWIDFDELPILFSNHFLVQHQPNEFVLTLGQVTGPPLVGTPEQIRQQASAASRVPIHTLARVGLTRERVTELIAILQATLEDHDRLGER
ncbi:MAG: hypothetical protein QOG70_1458 [Solirubrobacteraceae bacterium]|jgi:hypothetical protein|nr:hypothetical protein [Solirubrobacteraceae bacterium]